MYTVSILSQTSQQWRTIQVASLSEAVQLTLGLETSWKIKGEKLIGFYTGIGLVGELVLRNRYKHDNVVTYRLTDTELNNRNKRMLNTWNN